MSLADDLFDLRISRSTGRTGPAEYYLSMVSLVDAPRGNSPSDYADGICKCIRRIEAVLEDKLDAHGFTFRARVQSLQGRIPAGLQSELRAVAALDPPFSDLPKMPADRLARLQQTCDGALVATARQAWAMPSPGKASRQISAFQPAVVARGTVRSIRKSERRILPQSRKVQYLCVMDIDGRLKTMRSLSPPCIEAGDEVVVAGFGEHEASLYLNISKKAGRGTAMLRGRTALIFGAVGLLLGVAITGLAAALGLRNLRHSGIGSIGGWVALAIGGFLLSWISIWFLVISKELRRLARALDQVATGSRARLAL
jgi:hypothetical protein